MARKKRHGEEEAENMERWLVSYADFITLLFAFFVTMYAISRVDEQKLGSAVESLQRALGSVIPIETPRNQPGVFDQFTSPISMEMAPIQNKAGTKGEEEGLARLAHQIKEKLAEESSSEIGDAAQQVKFLMEERGLVVRLSDRFFFRTGEASIRDEVVPLLNVLGNSLKDLPNSIRIEGHTDDVPINTTQFPSNWELSTARATTIVRYLLTHFPFEPRKISAAGYGEFHPVAGNETPEGRLQNRRVDVVIMNSREKNAGPR